MRAKLDKLLSTGRFHWPSYWYGCVIAGLCSYVQGKPVSGITVWLHISFLAICLGMWAQRALNSHER